MRKYLIAICTGALLVGTAAAQEYPKVETFLGYTYVHTYSGSGFNNPDINPFGFNNPGISWQGGRGELVYNFNRWLGGVADLGAVQSGGFAGFDLNSTQFFFMGGPRFKFRRWGRFQPYAQAVFGGVYYTSSTPFQVVAAAQPNPEFPVLPVTARVGRNETKFALAAGLGLDIKVTRHLSFRPASVDYYYTRLGDLRSIGDNSQSNIMYSAGVNFMFGGEKAAPPAPTTKKCPDGSVVDINAACPKLTTGLVLTAQPSEICPGETSQVTAMSNNGANLGTFKHIWTVDGKGVSQDQTFAFTSQQPGTYTIGLNATNDKFNPAGAQTQIVVKAYEPPTGTVTANPAQIYVGEKSVLAANFTGQCGGPIQPPTYTASEGSVQGDQFDSSTVTFAPGEKSKTVTITAKAADNKTEGTATTTIEVLNKPSAAAIRLPDILFSRNSARVNNCGKRVLLDQLRSYYERDPGGSVAISGHQASDETAANLSDERALNAAAVVTAATGVCLSVPKDQVQVSAPGTDQQGVGFDSSFCASSVPAGPSSEERRVVVWFVPKGSEMPASMTNAQPASATNVGSLGCPR